MDDEKLLLINFKISSNEENTPKADIWLEEPEEHDYPAAQDYLELLLYLMKHKNYRKTKKLQL